MRFLMKMRLVKACSTSHPKEAHFEDHYYIQIEFFPLLPSAFWNKIQMNTPRKPDSKLNNINHISMSCEGISNLLQCYVWKDTSENSCCSFARHKSYLWCQHQVNRTVPISLISIIYHNNMPVFVKHCISSLPSSNPT